MKLRMIAVVSHIYEVGDIVCPKGNNQGQRYEVVEVLDLKLKLHPLYGNLGDFTAPTKEFDIVTPKTPVEPKKLKPSVDREWLNEQKLQKQRDRDWDKMRKLQAKAQIIVDKLVASGKLTQDELDRLQRLAHIIWEGASQDLPEMHNNQDMVVDVVADQMAGHNWMGYNPEPALIQKWDALLPVEHEAIVRAHLVV